jgi:tRNA1(Val) A37 N6-methylase TrmN6
MLMDIQLHPSERLDDLMAHNLKIVQSREVFSFSMDAVLLARFVHVPKRGKIVDLCSGNGVIPLLLSTRTQADIYGVEIQERVYDMAKRSVELNDLQNQIHMVHGDIKNSIEMLGRGTFDVLTVNPPYMPMTGSEINQNEHYAIARHEIYCTLDDVVRISAQLVRSGGKVAMVHRPTRFVDIISTMRKYRLEPKRIRFIHPKEGKPANMILVEGLRDGQPEVNVLPPLIVYNEKGEYTEEIYQIYNGERDGI